jgi:hypothetical protein
MSIFIKITGEFLAGATRASSRARKASTGRGIFFPHNVQGVVIQRMPGVEAAQRK